jgi:hypothetical protein
MHRLDGCILTNAEILIGIVGQNAISEHTHCHGYFLICAKTKQFDCIDLALKTLAFLLASFGDINKKRMPHSISTTKEIGRYLGKVVLHEHAMSKHAEGCKAIRPWILTASSSCLQAPLRKAST